MSIKGTKCIKMLNRIKSVDGIKNDANVKVQIMTTKVPHSVFNKVTFKLTKKMTSLVRL